MLALLLVGLLSTGCDRRPTPASSPEPVPSVRIYMVSTLAGAIEPCGCVKDMLGGIDHAAALIRKRRDVASRRLLVSAGPLFFMDPEIDPRKKAQEIWKAEALAASLRDLQLSGWAPGANDFAAGSVELKELAKGAGASVLAGNLTGLDFTEPFRIVDVGGYKVGLIGISVPKTPAGLPPSVVVSDPRKALVQSAEQLKRQGAQIQIALVALPRGQALRLAELGTGVDLMVVGKSFDRGEANDEPILPVLVGQTLVVQPPNHLQALAVLDLYVKKDSFEFKDGSGIKQQAERGRLERRRDELRKRIEQWRKNGAKREDLEARRRDLEKVETTLAELVAPKPPAENSFFRYELLEVRESVGADAQAAQRLKEYYKRVNEHNRVAFRDQKPAPVGPGQSSYVGAGSCEGCHAEAVQFWRSTPHFKAYLTLEQQDKQFNLDCVGCHVTGYDKPGGSTVTYVEGLSGVQCEVCHGPGSLHIADPADAERIAQAPARSLCAGACHHPPHVPEGWNADAKWPKILGKGHGY